MKLKQTDSKKTFVRTGIYVRVSTEEQAQEGFSIRAQTEKLKCYALLKDWEIYDIYADEGISGKNIVDRPAINRLISDINEGNVNNVLVFKVDRLTRSTKDLIELVELFEKQNCAFNSLTESIDTDTPSGRMFLKIIGIFAEFERENLVTRLKLGFERKVKEGYTLANYSLSYGYSKAKGQKVQTIQPDEAKIVREIFSMYLDENKSMSGIAKTLNERKIRTKRSGIMWDASTIKLLLTNPTYIGRVRYLGLEKDKYIEVDGHHESIISDEMFHLVQDKIKNTLNISRTKRPKEDNYFCGVLTCGMCGSRFTTHNYSSKIDENGKKQYKSSYRCNRKIYFNDVVKCKSPDISHEKMETAFSEYIQRINDFTEIEGVNAEDTKAQKERELLKYIADSEVKMNNLLNRKRKLMEQYVNEEIPFEDYKSMLDILNEKYETLGNELKRAELSLPTANGKPDVSQEDLILNLKENWDYLNNNERMMFLQRFVSKIIITVEKERRNSSIVRIEGIEFNSEPLLEKSQRNGIRQTLNRAGNTR